MNKIFATLFMLLVGAPAQAAPEAYARVEALRAQVLAQPPPFERRAQIGRAMKALGPDGLLPLLALIREERGLAHATPQVREMLLVGALEAVGALKDPRSAPVLAQILDGRESNLAIARAAAEALGQLEDDEAIARLTAHAVAGDPHERAAIAGLGFARRAGSVVALRLRLEQRPDPSTAEALAEAMGWLGSSWAWVALGPARADEGLALRDELSRALIASVTSYSGRARESLGRALLMIDHPSTPNRLAGLRASADPTLAADLQELERRWLHLR